jgi:hypothetical protein
MIKFEDNGDVVFDFGEYRGDYTAALVKASVAIGWIHGAKILPDHIEGTMFRLPVHKLQTKHQEVLREVILDFAKEYKLPIVLSKMTQNIKTGFYKHYKGGLYFVLTTGKHSETTEPMVLYYSLHYFTWWARPASMWDDLVDLEPVDYEVLPIRRFERVSLWYALTHLKKSK